VQLSLSAFNMRAITNFNEVTYHFLRAIFEHLHFSKGGAAGGGAQVRLNNECCAQKLSNCDLLVCISASTCMHCL
jgi:hypothetical protein